jgi:hypothetical protein
MRPEFIVSYISTGSILVPLGIAVVHGKTMPKDFKPLYLALVISMVCDVLAYFLASNKLNTHWIGNFYLAAQFYLLVLVFKNQFQNNRRVIDFILIFFTLFFIINISFFQGPLVFNSVSNVAACLILISFCLLYFYRLLNELPIMHIQHLPMLWISFAVLTYYGGNFFLFLVKNYLTYDTGQHMVMWILHNLLNITKNILFAIALWRSYRKVKLFTLSSSAP